MRKIIVPAFLAALLTIGAGAASVMAQDYGGRERHARAQFDRGYRQGIADERNEAMRRRRDDNRNYYAAHGFPDPWFSYGYGFGERDSWLFEGGRIPYGTENDQLGLFD